MNKPTQCNPADFAELLHDLNQPLTAINNYAQAGSTLLARDEPDLERLKDLFAKIEKQSVRSFELSKALRRLARTFSPASGDSQGAGDEP